MMLCVDQFTVLYDVGVLHEPVIHNELYIFSNVIFKRYNIVIFGGIDGFSRKVDI